ncbi:MAG: helix-turn-helix domain-containing protein [Gallionella sp.]|nr:helix-turn-helix domain-containing protein [Gallionella sp.]
MPRIRLMDANQIIDGIGGTVATAELCRVSPQAVSQWREDGIPEARLMFLQLARPEIFAKRNGKKTQVAA